MTDLVDELTRPEEQIDSFVVRQEGKVLDIHPAYDAIRTKGPIYQAAPGIWLVIGHQATRALLRDARLSRWTAAKMELGTPQTADPDLAAAMNATAWMMINRDEPDHTRLRKLVRHAFMPGMVEGWRPRIEAITHDIVDRALTLPGEFDFRDEIAFPLPERVICEIAGVPHDDRHLWSKWSREITQFNRVAATADDYRMVQEGTLGFYVYMRDLVAGRREALGDDLLSALIRAEEGGDQLSNDELIGAMIMLVLAGHETTANLLTNAMSHLLTQRDRFDELIADPGLAPAAIEEFLRFESPAHIGLPRVATDAIEHDGITIPAGARVFFSLAAASRDPAVFGDPNRIDFKRADIDRHLGFGFGAHSCIGQHLARLEGGIMLRELTTRMPTLALAETPRWRSGKPGIRASLRVVLAG